MLSKEQIEILTDKYITGLYDDLEREVIGDIARRVKKTGRFTETAELMAHSLREQGYSTARIQAEVHRNLNANKDYQREIAENTREYKQYVKGLIEQTEAEASKAGDMLVATAGDMSWNDDMQLWKAHDVDLKKPNNLDQLFRAIGEQTGQQLRNITNSSGFKNTILGTTGVYNAYQRTMDLAMIKVSSGAFSYQQAVKDCVEQLAKSGLRSIDYASGRSYQLDTAARMCIRTGANQLSGKIQEMNLTQTNTPLVYVDAHAGSRPEHAVWQGQVYAYNPDGILRDGSKAGEKYDDFFNETDYGSPTGLMGVNCAHHFYPYWEGDPMPEYKEPDPMEIDGKEYTYYEATQEMRRQERGIRQTRREIEAMKNLGEDTSALSRKLSKQMSDYKSFSQKANINPRSYALQVKPGTSSMAKRTLLTSAYSTERIHYDENAIFKAPKLGYNKGVMDAIESAARTVAEEGDKAKTECGILVGITSGKATGLIPSETGEFVFIPKDKIDEMDGEKYCFVHNHLANTPVSVGDAVGLLGYDGMHSIVAVRGNGEMTALSIERKEYQPFMDDDYYKINSEMHKNNKLTTVEKDSIIRDVIIRKSGMEIFE